MNKAAKIAMYLSAARAVLRQKKSYRLDKKLAREYVAMARAVRLGDMTQIGAVSA